MNYNDFAFISQITHFPGTYLATITLFFKFFELSSIVVIKRWGNWGFKRFSMCKCLYKLVWISKVFYFFIVFSSHSFSTLIDWIFILSICTEGSSKEYFKFSIIFVNESFVIRLENMVLSIQSVFSFLHLSTKILTCSSLRFISRRLNFSIFSVMLLTRKNMHSSDEYLPSKFTSFNSIHVLKMSWINSKFDVRLHEKLKSNTCNDLLFWCKVHWSNFLLTLNCNWLKIALIY